MSESLSDMVRAGRLALPTQSSFDRATWRTAHGQIDPNPTDSQLLASVFWFADELDAIRAEIAALRLDRADLARLTAELCGQCNFNFIRSEAYLRYALATRPPESFPMGSPAHVLMESPTGDLGSPDAWRTAATDTLGKALQTIFRTGTGSSHSRNPFGAASAARTAFSLFNRLYVMEFYCERVGWQGWRVDRQGDAYRLAPPHHDPFGESSILADWRRDQDHGEWTLLATAAWNEGRGVAERIVEANPARAAPRKYRTRFRHPGDETVPPSSVLRMQFECSDLSEVADQPLPSFGDARITLSDLVNAALLMGALARVLTDELIALGPETLPRRLAPRVAVAELCALLRDLGWRRSKCERVVEFFTYRGSSFDGVWSKPLVDAGPTHVMPILCALAAPNLYRSAEVWLADAGGDALQRDRGAKFEIRARAALAKAIEASDLAREACVGAPWSVRINGARRDVDIAVRLGTTVFIGEAKLKRFPSAPRESGRWMAELAKGAEQAKLRTQFLASQPASAAQATNYTGDPARLTFRPFVLVSGYFGAGAVVDDVPVIDLDCMVEFFDPGFFGVSGEILPGSQMRATRSVRFWNPGDDLARALAAYLREPVRVRTIEGAMAPEPRKMGVLARDGREILLAEPAVDAARFTPSQADRLQAEVKAIWEAALAAQNRATDAIL